MDRYMHMAATTKDSHWPPLCVHGQLTEHMCVLLTLTTFYVPSVLQSPHPPEPIIPCAAVGDDYRLLVTRYVRIQLSCVEKSLVCFIA